MQILCKASLLRGQRSARLHQHGAGTFRGDPREHSQKDVDPLPRNRRPDVENERTIGRIATIEAEEFAHAGVDRGVGLGRALGMHADGNQAEPIRGDQVVFEDRRTRGLAVANDDPGATKTRERAPRERAKPTRSRFDLGLEHAPKRIKIMTRDDRSIGGQTKNQLRITMINNMIKIECFKGGGAAGGAGVIEKAVEDTVGVFGGVFGAEAGKRRDSLAVRGPDRRGGDRVGMIAFVDGKKA